MRLCDDALVLRRTPFRETSLVLHFFTRHHGLLTAMARGVRATGRSSSKLDRAALAGFHTVVIGRTSRSIHHLGTLTSAEIRRPRHQLRHSATALMAAQVAQESIYRFMAPLEPRPEVFELLEWAWNRLDAGEDPLAVAGICQGRLVRAFGYGWRTDCCMGCGMTERLTYFSTKHGQVMCATCATSHTQQIFFLGDRLYHVLQQLEWTTDFNLLPKAEKTTLYRIGMASLDLISHGNPHLKILSDQSFRQMTHIVDFHSDKHGAP